MSPLTKPSKPDALDLAETFGIAASDFRACASFLTVTGDHEVLDDAREAAERVLAAIDEYEGRS